MEDFFIESIYKNSLELFTALQNIAFAEIENNDEFREFVLSQAANAISLVIEGKILGDIK